jgi:glutamate racemase
MNDLNENSPTLDHEDNKKIYKYLKIRLKTHQETSVKAMLNLEHNGFMRINFESYVSKNGIYTRTENPHYGWYDYAMRRRNEANYIDNEFMINTNFGILADKVGSGKTFDIIGMICHTRVPPNHPKIIGSTYCSTIVYMDKEQCIPTNLIILPHNLTSQWKKAFEFTKLKVLTISKRTHIDALKHADNLFSEGNNVEKTDGTESDESLNIVPEECVGYYDVVLLSATMMEEYYAKFPHIKYARIIMDEVTTVKKLPINLEIKCNFMWYISATPSGLLYIRKSYIREMVGNINYIVFKKIVIKNNDDYISASMNLPAMRQIVIHCDTPMSLRAIREFIPHDVMQMLNAGNIKEAVTRLNCNVDTDDNIINVLTSRTEKELHNKRQELDYQKRIIPVDARQHLELIKKIEERIASLETKLESIKDRIKSLNEDNCPICMDVFDSPAVLPCTHVYCLPCLTLIKNSKCPMCTQPFELKQLHVINNEEPKASSSKEEDKKLLSKKDNLVNIIKKKDKGKFIVFSNYDATNDNISNYLKDAGILCGKLVGNCNVINSTIEKFKAGIIRVLILNAQNYGSGLNLQMATDIIIYHEMIKELETQVIGRSQRMGRTQPLNVYYLLYDNEKSNCENPSLDLNVFDEDDAELQKVLNDDTVHEMTNIIDINVENTDDEGSDSDKRAKSKGKKKKDDEAKPKTRRKKKVEA